MAERKSSFSSPYLSQLQHWENEFIYFDRLDSDIVFLGHNIHNFKWLKSRAISQLNSINPSDIIDDVENYSTIGTLLVGLGKRERENEKRILKEYFQTSSDVEKLLEDNDDKKYIEMINKAIGFEKGLERAQQLFADFDPDKKYKISDDDTNIKLLQDEIQTYSNKVFEIAFNEVKKEMVNAIKNEDEGKFLQCFQKMMDRVSELFTEVTDKDDELFTSETKKLQEIINIFNTREDFKRSYGIILKDNYLKNFNPQGLLEKLRKQLGFKKGKNKRSSRSNYLTAVRKQVLDFEQLGNTASMTAELTAMAATKMHFKQGIVTLDVHTDKVAHNIFSADSIQIASVDGEVNIPPPTVEVTDKETARQYARELEQAVANANGNKKLIIYTSTKLYSVGTAQAGFHGTEYGYNAAVSLLNEIGYKDPDKLFWKLLNTISGAVLSGQGEEIKEKLRLAVARHIAEFMFDDAWNFAQAEAVDETGLDRLHLFNLENTVIPLSTLLLGLGKAFNSADGNYKTYATASINTPKSITDDYEPPADISDWIAERQTARSGFSIRVKILKNFSEEIKNSLPFA